MAKVSQKMAKVSQKMVKRYQAEFGRRAGSANTYAGTYASAEQADSALAVQRAHGKICQIREIMVDESYPLTAPAWPDEVLQRGRGVAQLNRSLDNGKCST